MTTINKEIKLKGICLMDGSEAEVNVFPSDKGKISFYPTNPDAGSCGEVEATVGNVISTLHCTVLGNQNNQVRVVEHFMAACAFSGIDSLDVCINGCELPIMDGSSKPWVDAFREAGIKEVSNKSIDFENPVYYSEGKTNIVLMPSEGFKVSYMVDFEHPDLKNSWVSCDFKSGFDDVIEARTFGYLKDLEKFQKSGFALGVTPDNTIGLTEDSYTVKLRSEYEPIKHKILDIVGDLRLLGVNPLDFNAHIVAKEAGHRTHIEFAKIISSLVREKV